MRILFGDEEAYLDKFKTSCRTRPIETQLLGTAYYMKEHTKPIFHKHKILAFKNLYNYQICLETLKILKSKIPYFLFQLHPLSSRNNQNFLVAKRNSSLFITNRIKLWNNCVEVISNTQTIPETSCRTRPIKTQLLGTAYYMKEHTKPIFHKHNILAFKNLYNYQICLETLKILKSKIPYYLFQLHPLSSRNNQVYLLQIELSCGTIVSKLYLTHKPSQKPKYQNIKI